MNWDTTLYDPETGEFTHNKVLDRMIRDKVVADVQDVENEFDEESTQLFTRLLLRYVYNGSMLFEFMFQVFREHNEEVYQIIMRSNHDEEYEIDMDKLNDICDCVKCQHALALMQSLGDYPLSVHCVLEQEGGMLERIPESITDFLEKFGGKDD